MAEQNHKAKTGADAFFTAMGASCCRGLGSDPRTQFSWLVCSQQVRSSIHNNNSIQFYHQATSRHFCVQYFENTSSINLWFYVQHVDESTSRFLRGMEFAELFMLTSQFCRRVIPQRMMKSGHVTCHDTEIYTEYVTKSYGSKHCRKYGSPLGIIPQSHFLSGTAGSIGIHNLH